MSIDWPIATVGQYGGCRRNEGSDPNKRGSGVWAKADDAAYIIDFALMDDD
jgi:hypothetical protein